MTIPALGLMRYLDQIEFPCALYGNDWKNPIPWDEEGVTRERLCELINRGLVRGIGSWKHLRRIHLICGDNLSVVSYCNQTPTKRKSRFQVKSDAGATTYREHLSTHIIVQHHRQRCLAWPH